MLTGKLVVHKSHGLNVRKGTFFRRAVSRERMDGYRTGEKE